jgi:hypothetical protein
VAPDDQSRLWPVISSPDVTPPLSSRWAIVAACGPQRCVRGHVLHGKLVEGGLRCPTEAPRAPWPMVSHLWERSGNHRCSRGRSTVLPAHLCKASPAVNFGDDLVAGIWTHSWGSRGRRFSTRGGAVSAPGLPPAEHANTDVRFWEQNGTARPGQAASDAVSVTVRRSLTYADAVTWPVWPVEH